jgi:hypothetical protein
LLGGVARRVAREERWPHSTKKSAKSFARMEVSFWMIERARSGRF